MRPRRRCSSSSAGPFAQATSCSTSGHSSGSTPCSPRDGAGHDGRVIAFEPTPSSAALARKHLAFNGLGPDRVTLVEAAVSDRAARATFHQYDAHAMPYVNSLARAVDTDASAVTTDVAVVTLDEVCRELRVVPTVIRMDVQGAEVHALRGARETIRAASRLSLVVEMHPQCWPAFGITEGDVRETLRDLGLSARPLVAGEALFARDTHAVLDCGRAGNQWHERDLPAIVFGPGRSRSGSPRRCRRAARFGAVRRRLKPFFAQVADAGQRRPALGPARWRSRARRRGVPAHQLEPAGVHGFPRCGPIGRRRARSRRQRRRVHHPLRAVGRRRWTGVCLRARSRRLRGPAGAHLAQRRRRSRDGGGCGRSPTAATRSCDSRSANRPASAGSCSRKRRR